MDGDGPCKPEWKLGYRTHFLLLADLFLIIILVVKGFPRLTLDDVFLSIREFNSDLIVVQ